MSKPLQRQLAAQVHSGVSELFLPSRDVWSKAAFFRGVRELFVWPLTVLGAPEALILLPLLAIPTAVIALPVYVLWWAWRQRCAQAGWRIDFATRQLLPVLLPRQTILQLSGDFGVLCHGRTIELTHPQRGPVLQLFVSGPMQVGDALDLNCLAESLAKRLELRVVGLRAQF